MKVQVEIDCTPAEARAFLGLPDVSAVNAVYTDALAEAMQGVSSPEQLQRYFEQVAPMGQYGLKMFQNFMEAAGQSTALATGAASEAGKARK